MYDRPIMIRLAPVRLILLTIAWVVILASPAGAQVLRYSGAPGTTRTYLREQRDHVVQTIDGRPTVTDIESTWRIRTLVSAETTDALTIGIFHDSLSITGAPSIGDLGVEALGRTPIEMVITPRGAVRELKVPADLPPVTARLDLETAYRTFFPRLPEEAVAEGFAWSDTTRLVARQNGLDLQVVRTNRYTSKGWATSGEIRVIRIDYASHLMLEGSGEQREAGIVLSGTGRSSGTFYFDPQAGAYVGGEESSTMRMVAFVNAHGQNIVIPIEQNRSEEVTSDPSDSL